MTDVDQIRAELDEAERLARAATGGLWHVNDESYPETIYSVDGTAVVAGGRWGGEAPVFESDADARFIAYMNPSRVLAWVAFIRDGLNLNRQTHQQQENG